MKSSAHDLRVLETARRSTFYTPTPLPTLVKKLGRPRWSPFLPFVITVLPCEVAEDGLQHRRRARSRLERRLVMDLARQGSAWFVGELAERPLHAPKRGPESEDYGLQLRLEMARQCSEN